MRISCIVREAGAILLLTAACVGLCHAADGEGTARLIPPNDFVAGSYTKFEVEYTAGAGGIAAGGGVAVMFHHALDALDRNVQLADSGKAGYVRVLSDTEGNLEASWVEWAPAGSLPRDCEIYHRGIMTQVLNAPVKAGEKVRFVFGAGREGLLWPIMTDERNRILVLTDADGDGRFAAIESSPANKVIAGPADHLFVTVPSTGVVGGTADVHVRAEDKYGNLAAGCDADVMLSGMPGLPKSSVKLKNGLAGITVPLAKAGVFRASASLKSEKATARSNPIVVTRKAPEYRIYWGDIHGHTELSDGLGESAADYLTYGRDAADLDVCAGAEHGHQNLEATRKAVKSFYEPGRFVTILGFEYSRRENLTGDMNVYFRSADDKPFTGWPRTLPEFWDTLFQTYGDNSDHRIILGPHMFTYKHGNGYWYKTWDPRYMRLVEIYSAHGMSEFYGNPRMVGDGGNPDFFMTEGLKYGVRFGVIASSDNHDSHPGRSTWGANRGGLVAFLAADLTRESIWDAFWSRRVYAATTERIYIDFSIDGHLMGEEFKASGKPKISYTVYGCDDSFDVSLVKNNGILKKTKTSKGKVKESFVDEAFEKDSYYYLRVVQANSEWAWTSPIWVEKT